MRNALVGSALALLLAARAGAAPMDYSAQLTVNFAQLPAIVAPLGGPATGTTNVSGGAFTLPAGIFTFSTVQVLPTPVQVATFFNFPVFLTQIGVAGSNATANLTTGGVGTMSIQGLAQLFLTVNGFGLPPQSVPLSGAFGVPNTLAGVPLGFGASATIIGQSFVPGIAQAATTLPSGTSPPTVVSVTGSGPSPTVGGGLSMNLVTATQVITNAPGGLPPTYTAVFGQLQVTLTQVPEPGAVLLLAGGLLGLGVLGWPRRSA